MLNMCNCYVHQIHNFNVSGQGDIPGGLFDLPTYWEKKIIITHHKSFKGETFAVFNCKSFPTIVFMVLLKYLKVLKKTHKECLLDPEGFPMTKHTYCVSYRNETQG